MTTLAAPTTRRLLGAAHLDHEDHVRTHGRLPKLDLEALLRLAEESGLTGRGGAGFPTALKVRAVATGRGAPVGLIRSQYSEPNPTTQDSIADCWRKPTALTNPLTSETTSRTCWSAPGRSLTLTTRKTADWLSASSTG